MQYQLLFDLQKEGKALGGYGKTELIIDKSFLDAASPEEMSELCKNYFVMMSYELFSELMTTTDESRQRCFNKFDDAAKPIALLPGVSDLLGYEIDNQKPCIPLSARCLAVKYEFHPGLRDGTFRFSGDVAEERDKMIVQFQDDTNNFADMYTMVHEFFPEIEAIHFPHRDFSLAVEMARKRVAFDSEFIRAVYQSFLEAQNSPSGWPEPRQINGEWAFFRWIQCKLLSSLRLYLKHQGRIPPETGRPFWTKTEHSMLDTYYLMLSTLSGALASADKAIVEDFHLVSSDGIVVSPAGWAKD